MRRNYVTGVALDAMGCHVHGFMCERASAETGRRISLSSRSARHATVDEAEEAGEVPSFCL